MLALLKDWGHQPNPIAGQSKSDGVLLFKGPGNEPEMGLWQCTPGTWPLDSRAMSSVISSADRPPTPMNRAR
jgi:uncharacterized cupin superfamily protein